MTLSHNTGAAFGIFQHHTHILTFLSILTILVILIFYRKISHSGRILRIGIGLVAGGASGNLIDRLMFGYVIDFLDFQVWPVFNIADSAITVGVVLLIGKQMRGRNVR